MRMMTPLAVCMQLALSVITAAVSSPLFAANQMALITIDPNNFAPGVSISNATTGAQLLTMTAAPDPSADPNNPNTAYVPVYSPTVYSVPIAAGCTWLFSGVPCTPSGNALLGYIPVTTPVTPLAGDFPLWNGPLFGDSCLITCGGYVANQLLRYPVLRINFAVPTDLVSTLALFSTGNHGTLMALDSNDNVIATCTGDSRIIPNPCVTTVIPAPGPGRDAGWERLTVATPSANITSFVIIGGDISDLRAIAQVQFDSPVSLQLAGLRRHVEEVGPGESLEIKVVLAEIFYALDDLKATCALLKGFVNEVNAQDGTSVDTLTAAQILSTASAIEAGIGCQ